MELSFKEVEKRVRGQKYKETRDRRYRSLEGLLYLLYPGTRSWWKILGIMLIWCDTADRKRAAEAWENL